MKAVRVENHDQLLEAPGRFMFGSGAGAGGEPGTSHLIFSCPKCGELNSVTLDTPAGRDYASDKTPLWKWDGNRDAPTLTPSIWKKDTPCGWHGFLTDGEWRTC